MKNLTLKKILPFILAGLLLVLAVLLMIPATNQALFRLVGIDITGVAKVSYNGFKAFIPFIPGYFPEDFEITYVSNNSIASRGADTYTETYASEKYFFQFIQSQGKAVPSQIPAGDLEIQGQPALLDPTDLAEISFTDSLDTAGFSLNDGWVLTTIWKGTYIQMVTNLPAEEAVSIIEGLVPAICTSTPTPEN